MEMNEAMSKQDYLSKREEILSKFSSPEIFLKYKKDSTFYHVIEMLIRGSDPYEMIERLIEDRLKIIDTLHNYIVNSPPRYKVEQPTIKTQQP